MKQKLRPGYKKKDKEVAKRLINTALHVMLGIGWEVDRDRYSADKKYRNTIVNQYIKFIDEQKAESPIEAVMLWHLKRAGLGGSFEYQKRIGRYRVDFLFSPDLIVECDGWEYHRDWDSFQRDRSRSNELTLKGYRILRYTGHHIVHNPRVFINDIKTMLAGVPPCVSP